MRPPAAPGYAATDLVYAGIAVVAAVLAAIGQQFNGWVLVGLVLALVPWVLVVVGAPLPQVLFSVLAIAPVIPIVAFTGIGSAIFLTTAAASCIASRSDSRWFVGIVTVVVVAVPFLPFLFSDERDMGAVYFAFGGGFGVLVGVLLRRSIRLAEQLRIADSELAKAAGREERNRIARDVHDLVAHSLTVVVLHVGGARRVLRADPAAAEAALAEAERVCRESLDGIRGVVGLLRDDDEPQVLSLDIGRLVATYRSAGFPVTLRMNGSVESLPLALRVTVYRTVQEALANAARHAGPRASARVELSIDDDDVVARVTNDRADRTNDEKDGTRGYGLLGLREQAVALGGGLTSGASDGSWIVECRLPAPNRALEQPETSG